LAKFDLRDYARRGAETRIIELNEELKAIYAAFPELRERGGRRGRRSASTASTPEDSAPKRARKRRKMSAAERKAVGERMRKYWAARKKSAAK
jgi:hypothetical protein